MVYPWDQPKTSSTLYLISPDLQYKNLKMFQNWWHGTLLCLIKYVNWKQNWYSLSLKVDHFQHITIWSNNSKMKLSTNNNCKIEKQFQVYLCIILLTFSSFLVLIVDSNLDHSKTSEPTTFVSKAPQSLFSKLLALAAITRNV